MLCRAARGARRALRSRKSRRTDRITHRERRLGVGVVSQVLRWVDGVGIWLDTDGDGLPIRLRLVRLPCGGVSSRIERGGDHGVVYVKRGGGGRWGGGGGRLNGGDSGRQ